MPRRYRKAQEEPKGTAGKYILQLADYVSQKTTKTRMIGVSIRRKDKKITDARKHIYKIESTYIAATLLPIKRSEGVCSVPAARSFLVSSRPCSPKIPWRKEIE